MDNKEGKNMIDSRADSVETMHDGEVNLYDLWKVIVKRKVIVIAIVLISLLGATMYCFLAPPIYRVETYVKLYMPNGITTVKEVPTGKDISLIIGKIDEEKKATIFPKTADEVTEAEIGETRGAPDKFKISVESKNRETLQQSVHEMLTYIGSIREIKSSYEKIMSEINERIGLVSQADKENDIQIKEIEKRLDKAKVLPVGFDPVAIRTNSLTLKMEKYRLERERQNYKLIQPLEDPFISQRPVKPKRAVIITIAGICSLIFGIGIVFIAEYLESVKKKTQCK